MPAQYSPRNFFRHVPNDLLDKYFKKKRIDLGDDFSNPKESKTDDIAKSFFKLEPRKQAKFEGEFQDIQALACEGGIQALIDEAAFHGGEDVFRDKLKKQEGFHAKVMWAYLNHRDYWHGASMFLHADNVSAWYWKKRNDLPHISPNVEEDDQKKLEKGISAMFGKEGRGKYCKVEAYRRHHKEYLFAYPEDYSMSYPEWVKGELENRAHHPAFEIIFVYCQDEGSLDIYAPKNGKRIADLQRVFAENILGLTTLPDGTIDERAYDMKPVMRSDFQFEIDPTSRVKRAVVTQLRLKLKRGEKRFVTLKADIGKNEQAVFELLNELNLPDFHINQIRVRVYFEPRFGKKNNHKEFNLTWPNSVALHHDGIDGEIRKMLAASGLELIQSAS